MRLLWVCALAVARGNPVVQQVVRRVLGSPEVDTQAGRVRGTTRGGVHEFKGIPYAAPPLAEKRWKAPEPAEKWPGILDAQDYKHNCLQTSDFDPAQPRDTLSEDCLYLNVFAPENVTNTPVLVWIHGGGFAGGGANESRLDGYYASSAQDLVIVTINYRLNIFGFTCASELGGGNFGLLDQRHALKWVQENIAAFGGDPDRVLVAGESAGGASVHFHLASNASWGLFSRALVESGSYALVSPQLEAEAYEKTYQSVLDATSCADAECLRGVDADKLLDVFDQLVHADGGSFQPCVDGATLPAQLLTLTRDEGTAPGVPLAIGSTREDLGFDALGDPPECAQNPNTCKKASFKNWAQSVATGMYPQLDADALTKAYSDDFYQAIPSLETDITSGWYFAMLRAGADAVMGCPSRRAALWHRDKAYVYEFARDPAGANGESGWAHHASDIPFTFHVLNATGPSADEFVLASPSDVELSAWIVAAWAGFAATGEMAQGWPTIANNHSAMLLPDTDDHPSVLPLYKEAACAVWDAAQENATSLRGIV